MRIFRAIPSWASALAAACLFTSAVALAAPEAGKTENELLTRTQRGYIVTAMSAGILDGAAADNGVITVREAAAITERLGGKNACHDGADVPLTRADAAVMLASIVDALR